MFETLKMITSLALLVVITMPVLIIILALFQNLLEGIKPKSKQKPVRKKSYYTDTDEFLPVKLRIVK